MEFLNENGETLNYSHLGGYNYTVTSPTEVKNWLYVAYHEDEIVVKPVALLSTNADGSYSYLVTFISDYHGKLPDVMLGNPYVIGLLNDERLVVELLKCFADLVMSWAEGDEPNQETFDMMKILRLLDD